MPVLYYLGNPWVCHLPIKLPTHDKTSSLMSVSYKIVFLKIQCSKSVLFSNDYYCTKFELYQDLQDEVGYDLSRNSCMKVYICGRYKLHTTQVFERKKRLHTKYVVEWCRSCCRSFSFLWIIPKRCCYCKAVLYSTDSSLSWKKNY